MYFRRRLLIDARLFVATVFSVLILSRILSLIIPTEFYFSFQSLFADRTSRNQLIALIGKMLAPAASGFGVGWLIYLKYTSSAEFRLSVFARRLKLQWSPTIFVGGFSAAFLSAWPIIVYWDLLANPEVLHLKLLFFALYLVYMLSYGYVALLGFLSALFVKESLEGKRKDAKLVSISELSRVGALWLLSSGVASAAMKVLTK
ncbi:hypothetical protein [Granulicella sibirica]|uniref:hypothetical protein n=1 Tax=Granulicella sibirica TaxID=2479048 RepID=UPI001008BFA5|nr:hypothetical protein [Granulicella sibirica]